MKRISPEEIEKRIKEKRPYISLDYSTFSTVNSTATFNDEKYGKWEAVVACILYSGNEHPQRSSDNKKIDIKTVLHRLKKFPELSLDISTFKTVSTKARFIDKEFGEFWARPSMVFLGRGHKKRGVIKRRTDLSEIVEKLKKYKPYITLIESTYVDWKTPCTFIDKYGTQFISTMSNIITSAKNKKNSNEAQSNLRLGRLSASEVESKIKKLDTNIVEMLHSTYYSTTKEAAFIDKDFGLFKKRPSLIFRSGFGHPKRSHLFIREATEIEQEIKLDRPFISMDYSTYKKPASKCRFIDDVYGEWWTRPQDVLNGHSHPKRGVFNKLIPIEQIEKEIKNKFDFVSVDKTTYNGSGKKCRFIDSKYGEWWQIPSFLRKGCGLHPRRTATILERMCETLLGIEKYNKKPEFLKGKRIVRPDFKLTENIYMDVDGLYWHSEIKKKNKEDHLLRRELFGSHKKRLLQFREDEIRDKPEILKSIVNNLLGKSTKIFGRKCMVTEDIPANFFITNHLMGYAPSKSVGLLYNTEIVCAMSYAIRNKNELHIVRFCNLLDTTVIGGFSKLLSHIIKKEKFVGNVVNYVDLRYGTGSSLNALGFNLEKISLSWRWTDFKYTYNRLKCTANMDARKLTQKEHAKELGWVKIYDAGQAKYIKTIK